MIGQVAATLVGCFAIGCAVAAVIIAIVQGVRNR